MQRVSHASWERVGRIGAVAGAAFAFLAAAAAEATFPGRNGLIAFEYNAQIASMRSDGTRVKTLTDEPNHVSQRPDWSPNGRRIAFLSSTGPALMAADGATWHTVPVAALPPFAGDKLSFSPDGRHLAYTRNSRPDGLGTRTEIWRTRIDGARDRRLGSGRRPEWSPDGRTIAYVRGDPLREDGPIALMSARTGKLIRRLDARASWLDWSPDGRWLLYSGRGRFGKLDLFVTSVDGRGSPRRLTRSGFRSEARAVWSPDGRKIAFVSAAGFGDESQGPGSIWTMRTDGTHKKRLHREPEVVSDVSWQPQAR